MADLDNIKSEAYSTLDDSMNLVQAVISGATDVLKQYPMVSAGIVGMLIWNNRKKLKLK